MTEISSAAGLRAELEQLLAVESENKIAGLQILLDKVRQRKQDFLWNMTHPDTTLSNATLNQFLAKEVQSMDELEILIYNSLIKI